jgi:hypothetical protein
VIAGALGIFLIAIPLQMTDPASGLIRVNEACGQATSCEKKIDYICSQKDGDRIDYKCKSGCDEN